MCKCMLRERHHTKPFFVFQENSQQAVYSLLRRNIVTVGRSVAEQAFVRSIEGKTCTVSDDRVSTPHPTSLKLLQLQPTERIASVYV